MNRRIRIVAAASLAVLVVTGAASAQGPGFGGFRGRGRMAGGPAALLPLRQLDLTEAQRTQIRQLAEQHRTTVRPLLERMRTAASARRQAIEAVPVDEGRIRAAVQELAQAQADLAVQQARLQSDVYGLLTAEQQERVRQLRAERRARR
jgi:protein CpxP